ncbi:hypothetical protein HJC06_30465 [Rhizobium sp. NLR9b]|nr:hypothetical protein [Rhizobium sp. NLR9b]MBX5291323.1 hypothetical protein [Rhizobium sp. NLR10b]
MAAISILVYKPRSDLGILKTPNLDSEIYRHCLSSSLGRGLRTALTDSLFEMPFVAELAGRSLPNIIGKVSAKFLSPKPHALRETMTPRAASISWAIRRLSEKPAIGPNGMGNHLRRKSVATIKRSRENLVMLLDPTF